jgi:hypothetical protein
MTGSRPPDAADAGTPRGSETEIEEEGALVKLVTSKPTGEAEATLVLPT